jgi:hypothetical protein
MKSSSVASRGGSGQAIERRELIEHVDVAQPESPS